MRMIRILPAGTLFALKLRDRKRGLEIRRMHWCEERRKAVCGKTYARFDEGGQARACALLYPSTFKGAFREDSLLLLLSVPDCARWHHRFADRR